MIKKLVVVMLCVLLFGCGSSTGSGEDKVERYKKELSVLQNSSAEYDVSHYEKLVDELADDLIEEGKILVTKDEFNQVMKEATEGFNENQMAMYYKMAAQTMLTEYLDGNANVEEISNEYVESELANSKEYQNAILSAQTLKDSLNNPNSFQLHSVRYAKNGYYEYYKMDISGENKLGGTTRQDYIAIIFQGKLDNIIKEGHADWYKSNEVVRKADFLDVDLIKANIK